MRLKSRLPVSNTQHQIRGRNSLAVALALFSACCGTSDLTSQAYAVASDAPQEAPVAQSPAPTAPAKPKVDRSGRKRTGLASFYAKKFAGRTMADGTTMHPQGDNAASKTLPLGTIAKVTNLDTGQSAVVTIRDRGPYVKGRIVDLSPSTAQKIGIEHDQGVSLVAVAPITIPLPGGSVKRSVSATAGESTKDKSMYGDWGK